MAGNDLSPQLQNAFPPTTDTPLSSDPASEKHHPLSTPPPQDLESPPLTTLHPDDNLRPPSKTNPPMSPLHELLFLLTSCASNILTQAALGMTVAPLLPIASTFHTLSNPASHSWFIAAYSLTVGTFILPAGRLGDIHGHKRLFVAGLLWFGVWSLVAGLSAYAGSDVFFDVSRAMQGVGPAMMVPNSLAILGRTYRAGTRRKEMVFALYGATAPNGFLVGAVFGSLLAGRVGWEWAFYVMGLTCFAFGGLAVLVIPGDGRGRGRVEGDGAGAGAGAGGDEDKSFDYLGAVTGVAGLVLFNVAWNQAPIVGWKDPAVIVLLILGLAAIVAFCFIEQRVAQPLIPAGAMSGKVGFVLGCIALGWASFGIWMYYLFQILENLREYTPLEAAAQCVPAGVSGFAAAITTGFILSKLRTSYVMAISMLGFCIGSILIGTMPVDQIYWAQTFASLVVTPWGMDMSFPAATIILSDFVPQQHQGIAASLVVTVVNYSISIGLGIAGTVESKVNDGGRDLLLGYRGALYAAIGLSGMAVLLASSFVVVEGRVLSKKAADKVGNGAKLKTVLSPVRKA